jgi:hypothetical protein
LTNKGIQKILNVDESERKEKKQEKEETNRERERSGEASIVLLFAMHWGVHLVTAFLTQPRGFLQISKGSVRKFYCL